MYGGKNWHFEADNHSRWYRAKLQLHTHTVTRMFTDCDPSDNDGKEGEKICSKKVLHRRLLVRQSNVDHDVVSGGDYLYNSRDTLFVICHRCTKV